MTALVPSRWLWLSLSIRSGEEGRPCDYPSTNSRAQSGHHGPGKTCNHAVLQHLPREPRDGFVFPAGTRVPESTSFDLAYQQMYQRNVARFQDVRKETLRFEIATRIGGKSSCCSAIGRYLKRGGRIFQKIQIRKFTNDETRYLETS